MKTSEQIRQSLVDLNPYASNREIHKHCKNKYGSNPSPQLIYESIGSEKERLAQTYNGRELMDLRQFAKKKFNGDFERLNGALRVVMSDNSYIRDEPLTNVMIRLGCYDIEAIEADRQKMKIKVKKLTERAEIPTKTNKSDAGWDLYSCCHTMVAPQKRKAIPTGIAISIPKGCVGLIWPRSGLAVKSGIDVFAGVIDSGYIGEIKVCLYNSGEEILEINYGDRIAQMVIQEIPVFDLIESDNLDDTDRGDSGFGSSGK